MAQEIRLGSSESMKNINLGSTELQEVYLGATLIWRNNVPPFYSISINGIVISSNGTIITPVKPPKPSVIPSQNFQYTSDIPILISNIEEEDQPAGNIVFNLYDGNFEEDETLPVIETFTTTAGTDGTFTVPKGPQPTGGTAPNFIYDDKLFTITATDSEGGISIQFLKITRVDSADVKNYGSWGNSGGQYNHRTSSSTQYNLQSVSGNQCYSTTQTTSLYNRTTTTPIASQNQSRTCSVQIVGIQDNPPKVCSGGDISRTINVTTGTGSSTNTVTSSTTSPNPSFVSGVDVVVPSNQTSTSSSSVGSCGGVNGGAACDRCSETCSGTGVQTITTTTTLINRNCANQQVSTSPGGTTTTDQTCTGTYSNPAKPTQTLVSLGVGSNTYPNFSTYPSRGRTFGGIPQTFDVTLTGTCKPGFTISECRVGTGTGQLSWSVVSGGIGTSTCSLNLSGTASASNNTYCSTSSIAVNGGFDGMYVITSISLMNCV